MDIIFGRNAVKSALKSQRTIDKLFAMKDIADPSVREVLMLAAEKSVPVVRVDKRKLDNLALPYGYAGKPANHQGVIAVTAAKEYGSLEDIFSLAASKNEPPFIVVLDGITDEGNLGSIIRSAEVLGAHGVIIGKRRSASLSSVTYKASSGAAERIPVVKVTNLNTTINELKEKGVWAVAADTAGQSADTLDLKGSVAIVIGSEGEGISRLVLENCDFRASIPMKGETGSLNAAVAAAILMYEKARQQR